MKSVEVGKAPASKSTNKKPFGVKICKFIVLSSFCLELIFAPLQVSAAVYGMIAKQEEHDLGVWPFVGVTVFSIIHLAYFAFVPALGAYRESKTPIITHCILFLLFFGGPSFAGIVVFKGNDAFLPDNIFLAIVVIVASLVASFAILSWIACVYMACALPDPKSQPSMASTEHPSSGHEQEAKTVTTPITKNIA